MLRVLSFILSILLYQSIIFSQDIVISEDFESTMVGTYSHLYEDKKGDKTLDDILTIPDSQWEKQNHSHIVKGLFSSNFWVQFNLKNVTSKEQEILLAVENGSFNRVKFHTVTNSILSDTSMLMGDILTFSKREINHRHFLHSITLAPNSNATIYTMVGKDGGKLNLPYWIYSKDIWLRKSMLNYSYFGLVLGLLSMLIIGGIILFCNIQKGYPIFLTLQFVFVLLFFLAYSGLGYQYIWPDNFYLQQGMLIMPGNLMFFFKALFILSFFDLNQLKTSKKYLRLTINLQFIGVLLPFIGLLISTLIFGGLNQEIYHFIKKSTLISGLIGQLTIMFSIVLMFIILINLYKERKDKGLLLYTGLTIMQFFNILFLYFTYFIEINVSNIKAANLIILFSILEGIIILAIVILEYKNTVFLKNKLQLELSQKQNEALNNLLKGQEIERKRLSQEVHDGLSIRLLQIKAGFKKLLSNKEKSIPEKLPKLINELDIIHDDLRNFSHALNPTMLENFGLKKAINDIIFNIEMNHEDLDIDFNCPDTLSIDKEKETHFYYIIQEFLNNTIKYAKANKIKCELLKSNNSLCLKYFDNGIGYDFENNHSNGIGLNNIKSRVDLIQGKLEIQNIHPKGIEHKISILD